MNVKNYYNMEKKIIITTEIINYAKSKFTFEIIPQQRSIWNVKDVSYPNVYGGFPIVELENDKSEWLRIPKSIINH